MSLGALALVLLLACLALPHPAGIARALADVTTGAAMCAALLGRPAPAGGQEDQS